MPNPQHEVATPGHRLRSLMDAGCVAAPGAFNALAARAIARAGFDACYISGAATSVSAGVPDVGLLTLEHFARAIREASDASGLPVLADADTGFGEAEMVRRTVIEYARAGGAGLHLEDQKFPKRCGHLDGKELVPVDHMAEKVEWAARARDDVDPGFVVCARTDARGVEGLDAAIARAGEYVRAGADMIFPEGLADASEFARFAEAMRRLRGPAGRTGPYVLANMTEFGKTPIIPLSQFASMGYSIVIYPVTLLRVAMGAVTRALETLKRDGSAQGLLNDMQTRAALYDLIGYTPGTPWECPPRRDPPG
ncbi:MAG: isocitrate lyase/phosphoenolpyruvate mutase family protein [Planctomycetota bacterium]|nr:isocitrate lyase/phosphoenolpyruvate mutase family protein [Planctomycetota bacterium]